MPGSRAAAVRVHPPALVLAVVALLATLLGTSAASASPSEESAFVDGVNQARAELGLPALIVNNELVSLARGWTTEMRDGVCGDGDWICHANPISEGMTQDWAKLGENVGTGPDVESVMEAFIASPGHYANIIDPAFTHIGVGVFRDLENPARLYTTHRFMKLRDGAVPAPTVEPDPVDAERDDTDAVSDTEPATPTTSPSTSTPPAPVEPAGDPIAADSDSAAAPDRAGTDPDPAEPAEPDASEPAPSPPPVSSDRARAVVDAIARMG